jgi:hypothetical protein
MDAQLEKIQGQIGTAVLDAGNGKVVKVSGSWIFLHTILINDCSHICAFETC